MKKLLIIAIVALLAAPAMGDAGWFITGPVKTTCSVPVNMVIPPFYTFVTQPTQVLLTEVEGTPNWSGSATWTFINNADVTLTATLDPTGQVAADAYLVDISGVTSPTPLTTSHVYPAMVNAFPPNSATIDVLLTNVAYFGHVGQTLEVAELTLTLSL
jgi:hypothetical protein